MKPTFPFKIYFDYIEFNSFNNKIVKCTIHASMVGEYIEESCKFSAVAKCHDDDVFDLEKGKRIAESKASLKVFKYFEAMCSKSITNLNKQIEELYRYKDKVNGLNFKESLHLGTLNL